MFNSESVVVQTWVRLIRSGAKTEEEVPALFDLREAVAKLLEEK